MTHRCRSLCSRGFYRGSNIPASVFSRDPLEPFTVCSKNSRKISPFQRNPFRLFPVFNPGSAQPYPKRTVPSRAAPEFSAGATVTARRTDVRGYHAPLFKLRQPGFPAGAPLFATSPAPSDIPGALWTTGMEYTTSTTRWASSPSRQLSAPKISR